MSQAMTISILMTIIGAATPLLLAALGELVAEKSGVLNLGVEGMMLIGAVTAFAVTQTTGHPLAGLVAAMAAASAASMIFGYLTLTLAANQVATGLALTIFGIGLSSMIGEHYVGTTIAPLGPVFPAALAQHPVLRVVFGHSILVYASLAATAGVAWFLARIRAGLVLRAVGENDHSAHSIGYSVLGVRYAAVAFGGAMAGLGGAYFALISAGTFTPGMTHGLGFLAIVVAMLGRGRLPWVLLISLVYGLLVALGTVLQLTTVTIPNDVISMLPFVVVMVVLTLFPRSSALPPALATPYVRGAR